MTRVWLPLVTLISCLLPPSASAAAAGNGPASSLQDARAWLARIHAAADNGNYQGTMVFSANGTMSSSRVWHYSVGEQTYEQLEALDGRQQRIVRHNDAVHTLWPQTRVAVVEKRTTMVAWSTTPQAIEPRALEQYELKREGGARIAGREAVIFLLEPRDELRYAQRLWADELTGLMLRADVIAAGAGPVALRLVLESTAFSEIAIGLRPPPGLLEQTVRSLRTLDGYRVVRPQQQSTTLDAHGWALTRPVAGFRLAGCVSRGLVEAAAHAEPVLQAVFTDGLTHVSVFFEPYKPQRHGERLLAQQGATATLMQRHGAHWVTAVGDVPPATLILFAEAIERRRP